MLPYLFFRFVFCCCNRVVAKKSFEGGGVVKGLLVANPGGLFTFSYLKNSASFILHTFFLIFC